MDKFERLNRETRDWNNGVTRSLDPTSGPKYGTTEYWQNYWNNKTYKTNNGEYSRKYF